jgi:ABC-type Mn2+/Zn2+ transport system permease subunit
MRWRMPCYPGVAIAYLMGANLLMGALAAAVVVALLISLFSRQGTIKEDTAIGIVFAAALALGVALISSVRTYAVDLTHIMFGNVLGVSPTDVWLIAGIGAAVLLTILAFYRQFLVIAFDPVLAATQRLPVERLRMLLLLLIALTIVVSLQTVGVGLVAAMLVTPGATAYLLTRRLPTMMMVAALIGAVASISGLYLSYYINIASGAAVVLVATALFTAVFLFAPERGVVWRRG